VTACVLCAQSAAGQPLEDEQLSKLSIGVAPFEQVAPPGATTPELASPLTAQILARGAGRTVSPATLAGEGLAEPSDEQVRSLAEEHGLDALVVGRVTRLGERVSIDVRLRDGRTGAVAGTYVAELSVRDSPDTVLEHLATQLVSGALTLTQISLAAAPSEPRAAPAPGRPSTRPAPAPGRPSTRPAPANRLSLDRSEGEPFSIRSDELEATEQEGRRTLVFSRNVNARRGDLELRTDRLVADYPEGAKAPSRLVAQGGVDIRQGQRRAHCQRAEYRSSEERVVCSGAARLRDGEDELRGESIVFDLAEQRVTVEGSEVALTPKGEDGESGAGPASLGELTGEGRVSIRASQLEATEEESGARRIRFEGSVEVVGEDLVLKAREIEALYPPGAKEPSELVATGEVQVLQRGREARCDRAVYRSETRRVDCRGTASLREGEDSVTGEAIVFDLEAEKLVVSGGTRLVLAPRDRQERGTP
jgi:lipopolysaccharide transport protein LptA